MANEAVLMHRCDGDEGRIGRSCMTHAEAVSLDPLKCPTKSDVFVTQ